MVLTEHNTVVPLAGELGVPWGSRVSPGAPALLVCAGAEVPCLRSARLLGMAGGSRASAATVMSMPRGVGSLCAEGDARAAEDLFSNGVLPDAGTEAAEVCLEADGTWLRLQRVPEGEPGRVEVKALVAYRGKEARGAKTARVQPVRHGRVGAAAGLWSEGVAAVGTRFDLSKVERCHPGGDGEPMYPGGGAWMSCDADAHLDPLHADRAVPSRLGPDDRKLAGQMLPVVMDGEAGTAARLLDVCAESGIGSRRVPKVAAYLRNDADAIHSGGPVPGTMGAEQRHVHGCGMDSVPCAWSREGADAMARIKSRICSGRDLPRPTREGSSTPRRKRRAERRELSRLSKRGAGEVPEAVGSGKGAEHVSSVAGMPAEVRYAAGVDSGMVAL